jgi:hypothetical protein
MQTRPIFHRGLRPAAVSLLSSLGLLAGLLALGAVPARADFTVSSAFDNSPYTISATQHSLVTENIIVQADGVLNIEAGGSVTGKIFVQGGTLNVSGGSVQHAGDFGAIQVVGGTLNLFAGLVSNSSSYGIFAQFGTTNIFGGTVTGFPGIYCSFGIVYINGCGLQRSGGLSGTLTGHLANGQEISTTFQGSIILHNLPTAITVTPPSGTTAIANTSTATGIGATVNFSPVSATDACGGSVPVSYSDGHTPGSFFPLGTTLVTATIPGAAGPYTFYVTVAYAPFGVLQPINTDGTSVFKAGRTVPVKFVLTGASAGITDAVATLSYTWLDGGTDAVNEADAPGQATSGNQFRYDATSGCYVFNWSTQGLAPGHYLLSINLGDGVVRTVKVGLR